MTDIAILASNLRVGGGLQVAASVIIELGRILSVSKRNDLRFWLFVSTELDEILVQQRAFLCGFAGYEVVDCKGISAFFSINSQIRGKYDVCFTIFGPSYVRVRAKYHVVGFAQPAIAYPDSAAMRLIPIWKRLWLRAKYELQWRFFKRAHVLIVEASHVRDALSLNRDWRRVLVIDNCVSSLFLDCEQWVSLDRTPEWGGTSGPILGFLGRGYSHKNLRILLEVDLILRVEYGFPVRFLFTLTEGEMRDHGFTLRDNFFSVGAITPARCPAFYGEIDALVFPTLLECYSVTPIESMIMGRPVFASDLPCVRDLCGEHVTYFDPSDARDIARSIWAGLRHPGELSAKTEGARAFALGLPTAQDRARAYLDVMTSYAVGGEFLGGQIRV